MLSLVNYLGMHPDAVDFRICGEPAFPVREGATLCYLVLLRARDVHSERVKMVW